jgi:PST family polysaccharide transporter
MIVMARLLLPAEFGMFGMVTAFTGFLALFRDFGLSLASVTRAAVTDEQISTLFWVNMFVGVVLTLLCIVSGPLLAGFYAEPRLIPIASALGIGFMIGGAGVQHRALLMRELRFVTLASIDMTSLVVGTIAGITMAASALGYWSLVAMALAPQIVSTVGMWWATKWIPRRPRTRAGVRSMIWFGGGATFNGLIVYLAYNFDKVLIGRVLGAEALGLYGRAYQLVNLPTDNLYSAISQVAFPTLARLQADSDRLRSYFLQGYSLLFAAVLPVTVGSALFAEDIIGVFLGPRWVAAADTFRFLAPTVLVFSFLNPFGWLLTATGRMARSVKMALVIAPVVMVGVTIGLRWGAEGAASGFSVAMLILAWPLVAWAKRDTAITDKDVVDAILPALTSASVGLAATSVSRVYVAAIVHTFARLVVETGILFGVYAFVLLVAMRQWRSYRRIVKELRFRSARI